MIGCTSPSNEKWGIAALYLLIAAVGALCAVALGFAWYDSYRILRMWSSRAYEDVYDDSAERRLWSLNSVCGKAALVGLYNPHHARPALTWHGKMLGPGQKPGPVKKRVDLAAGCDWRFLGFGYDRQYGGPLGPLDTIYIVIPYWAPLLLATLVSFTFSFASCRRFRRILRSAPHGRCECCGYDLRASRERCPECGAPIPAKRLEAPQQNVL